MSNPLCRLYLITPNFADADAFAPALEAALRGGDVSALQIRLKDVSDDDIRRACRVLAPIAQAHDVAVILNDRPDLAAELGLDGVHVGQEDAPYAAARKRVGPAAIVGVTCHDSRHLAMEAAEAGADYVAFGAFYPTETKAAPTSAPLDLLRVWQETMQTPCVAIGGITADNAAEVAAAGADFLAVSAGVFAYTGGPGEAVGRIGAAIEAGLRQRSV